YDLPLGDVEPSAEALHRRFPNIAEHALLLGEIRRRLGQTEAACAVIQQTLDQTQEPTGALRRRIRDLRCRAYGW
ncbi:MAG: hypothetical protein AAF449_01215, partial [Myxococcota bacterium]